MMTSVIAQDCRQLVAELGETLAPLGGRSVLVTGAGGFIGSFVMDCLAAFNETRNGMPPARITGIDNFRVALPARLEHLKSDRNITLMAGDVREMPSLPNVPDYIIHCASIGSPMIYRSRPIEIIATNVDGTRNMLELARRGTTSMISMSSSEVYGDPDPAWIPTPENYNGFVSFTGPRACYDESKRLGETLCTAYHAQHGVRVKSIRPFNVYGPGQRIDDGRIIPDLMQAALSGRPITLYSDGRATRSFCYITDFLKGCFLVLMSNAEGEAFNVGNDDEITIADAAHIMASVAQDPPLPIEFKISEDADFLTDNPQRRCPDLTKLRGLRGWEPRISLREGLARTIQSYREQESAQCDDSQSMAAAPR